MLSRCLNQNWSRSLAVVAVWVVLGTLGFAQQPDFELTPEQAAAFEKFASIQWQDGPTIGTIGDNAQIEVPAGCRFTGRAGAQALLEFYGNPANPSILAAIIPTSDDEDWTLVFQFDDIGYVKDEDRDELDADALLKTFRDSIPQQNEYRREAGVEEMTNITWTEPPFYDAETNNLTWAMRLHFPTGDSINYDIRLLGRYGVMEATLIGSPETYAASVPKAKAVLKGFSFTSGNRYAEWKAGDKVAAIGLAGLVAGGATVIAAKSGLLAKIGLLLAKGGKAAVVLVIALGAGLLSLVRRLFTGGRNQVQ